MKKRNFLKISLLLILSIFVLSACAGDDLPSPILPEETVEDWEDGTGNPSTTIEGDDTSDSTAKDEEKSENPKESVEKPVESDSTKTEVEKPGVDKPEVTKPSKPSESSKPSKEDTSEKEEPYYAPGTYDSADTAVLVRVDSKKKTITLRNFEVNKNYTLSYDGTTYFYDSYGQGMSAKQLVVGDIVDVTFLYKIKRLTTLRTSSTAWNFTDTGEYRFNEAKRELLLGENTYKIDKDALFFSDSHQIQLMDINPVDRLSFFGINNTIFSVVVSSGHGYLRLKGQENFVDGWIEVGTTVIQKVTDEMLLAVPEGKYEVKLSNNGNVFFETVSIKKDQETELDVSSFVPKEAKKGLILFSVTPSTATLHIDGNQVDFSKGVELTYGLHQLICRAKGYKSITQYLSVGQPSAGVDITMEESTSEEEEKDSTDKGDTTSTSYNKVYIDAPENVEVYLDGTYVGVSPCSFKKVSGSHVITLSKEGYVTRSYTVNISDEKKDETYSFDKLVSTSGDNGDSDGNVGDGNGEAGNEGGDIGTPDGVSDTPSTGDKDTPGDNTSTDNPSKPSDSSSDEKKPDDNSGNGDNSKPDDSNNKPGDTKPDKPGNADDQETGENEPSNPNNDTGKDEPASPDNSETKPDNPPEETGGIL